MVRTIPNVSIYTKHRITTKDTCLSCFLDTLANCWDILLRNCTTDNGRLELECLLTVRIHWFKFNFTMSVLTTSTGLLSILTVDINSLSDCLLVCYLWSTNICFYLKLTKETVYDNFQMKLAHSGDDCLTGL